MLQKIISLINKNNKEYTINFNWGFLISFVFFWTYGYYGALTKFDSLIENLIVTFLLSLIFIFFLNFSFHGKGYLNETFIFSKSDVKYFFFFFFILFTISFSSLFNFINGDHFYHSQFSIYHSIHILKIINQKTQSVNLIKAKYILHFINVIILVSLIWFINFISKINIKNLKIVILVCLFLIFRILIIYFGGSADTHPAFRLFPLWLSSTLFGINSFAFRFPQFFTLIILVFLTFKTTLKYLNEKMAFLFAIAIGTIPILIHTSILVEQSIWATIIITYILYNLFNKINYQSYEINYMRLASIIAIGVLIRQSIAACVIFLIIFLIIEFSRNKINILNLFKISSIFLLCLPFLFSNFLIKNPALSSIKNELVESGILYSITSGISFFSILNNFLYLIFFLPFSFLIYKRNNIYVYLYLLLAILLYSEFYSIRFVLWGVGRYQSEFVLPFIIIAILIVSFKFKFLSKHLYIILIFLNILVFYNYNKFNKHPDILKYTYFNDIKKPFGHFIQSEGIYPYSKALKSIKENGYSKSFYIYGTTYGNMPLVLSGYNVKEVFNYNQLNKNNTPDADSIFINIQKNKNLELVIFTDLADSMLFNEFKINHWIDFQKYSENSNSGTIKSLLRSQN